MNVDDENDPGGPSRLSALDLRIRLLAATAAAFAFSAFQQLSPACIALALAAGLVAWRRRPVPTLARQLVAANFFIFFMALTIPLSVPGDAVARLGPLAWSREGVALALLVAVKANAILLTFIALVAGARLSMIGCALDELRVPPKLTFLFLFTSRYLRTIADEWNRLWTAARLRGFAPRNSWHTYRTVAHLLGLTFVHGIDRAHRVYEAMVLRGFHGTFHTVTAFRRTRADTVFAVSFSAGLAGLWLLDFRWE